MESPCSIMNMQREHSAETKRQGGPIWQIISVSSGLRATDRNRDRGFSIVFFP
jgi:hypothetical protein